MYTFKKIIPEYTGGGIYVFLGELDKNYFMADSCNFDVMILDENPIKNEDDPEYEDIWYFEWQEKHLIESLNSTECLNFFTDLFKWVEENKPSGNYSPEELRWFAQEVEELKGQKDWR